MTKSSCVQKYCTKKQNDFKELHNSFQLAELEKHWQSNLRTTQTEKALSRIFYNLIRTLLNQDTSCLIAETTKMKMKTRSKKLMKMKKRRRSLREELLLLHGPGVVTKQQTRRKLWRVAVYFWFVSEQQRWSSGSDVAELQYLLHWSMQSRSAE